MAACDVQSNNGVFGDPCVGTYKFLKVKYICVAPAPERKYSTTVLTLTF